jgi:hypothetical protein
VEEVAGLLGGTNAVFNSEMRPRTDSRLTSLRSAGT